MGSVKGRVDRLERGLGSDAADREHHLWLMQTMSQIIESAYPGFELVQPQDTDKRTYAYIQSVRLTAAGDHAAAAVWQAKLPPPPEPPPEAYDSPIGLAAWSTECAHEHPAGGRDKVELAVARAQARTAAPGRPTKGRRR